MMYIHKPRIAKSLPDFRFLRNHDTVFLISYMLLDKLITVYECVNISNFEPFKTLCIQFTS
jgi:hypothetical protein